MKIISFFFVCLFAMMLSACSESIGSKYGPKYNSEREKLGIPIIPTNWTSHGGDQWYNPIQDGQLTRRIPVHQSKFIDVRNGVLLLEEDEYDGSESYHDQDGTYRESLFVTYCYQADIKCHGKTGWGILYQSQKTFDEQTYDTLNLDDAKKILKDWGISFP